MHTPNELVKQAPAYWTKEQAIEEANNVIREYTRRWLPTTNKKLYGDEGQYYLPIRS